MYLAWTADDPLVKRITAQNVVDFERPTSLFVVDGAGPPHLVGRRLSGGLFTGGGRVWAFLESRGEHDPTAICEVLLDRRELAPPLPVRCDSPVAVLADRVVELRSELGRWDPPGDATGEDDDLDWGAVARLVPATGGPALEVVLGRLELAPSVAAVGSTLWFWSRAGDELVALDVESATARRVRLAVDLGPFAPVVQPPPGVDLAAYEQDWLAIMRHRLQDGWVGRDGQPVSFVGGVDVESVELEGRFPDTAIVARFRAEEERPGVLFARRWLLYDGLGNCDPPEYADIHLMEDLMTSPGLPPMSMCVSDDDGIVWY